MPSAPFSVVGGGAATPGEGLVTCTYEFAGLRVSAKSNDPITLDWLTEFLCPNFEIASGGTADCTVTAIADPFRYAERLALTGRADGRGVDCFARDTGTVRLVKWDLGGGRQLIHDNTFKAFYLLDPAAKEIEVVTADATQELRVSFMRAVRELAMNAAIQRGYLVVHGAALRVNGSGVAIVGPKQAGKTTLLLALLTATGGAFVANDRFAVGEGPDGPEALGIPTIVSIRGATLWSHPAIGRELRKRSHRHARTMAETLAAGASTANPTDIDRVSINPAQFCNLAGVPRVARTPLSALVFPRTDTKTPNSTLVPLDRTAAASRMSAGLFRAAQPPETTTVFCVFAAGIGVATEDGALTGERLVSLIPSYDCLIGADLLGDPARGKSMIEALLDRRP